MTQKDLIKAESVLLNAMNEPHSDVDQVIAAAALFLGAMIDVAIQGPLDEPEDGIPDRLEDIRIGLNDVRDELREIRRSIDTFPAPLP